MDGNFSYCDCCNGNHETNECLEMIAARDLIDRVSHIPPNIVAQRIDQSHPVITDSEKSLKADALAMNLIHGRHEKRELVNLIRWCLMGCP